MRIYLMHLKCLFDHSLVVRWGNDLPVKLSAVKTSMNWYAYNKLEPSNYRSSHVQKWVGEKDAGSAIGGAPMFL